MRCNVPCAATAISQSPSGQGVEIDFWPQCRGVRLDRGELGEIIEHTDEHHAAAEDHDRERPGLGDPADKDEGHGKNKRKSLLNQLLDF